MAKAVRGSDAAASGSAEEQMVEAKPKRARKPAAPAALSASAGEKPEGAKPKRASRAKPKSENATAEATAAMPSDSASFSAADAEAAAQPHAARSRSAGKAAAGAKPKTVKKQAADAAKAPSAGASQPKPRKAKASIVPEPKSDTPASAPGRADMQPGNGSMADTGAIAPGSSETEEPVADASAVASHPVGASEQSSSEAETIDLMAADAQAQEPATAENDASATAPERLPSADKPWLASYPPNVPAEISGLPADSLGALMTNACRRYAGRIAFTCMGRDLRFSELDEMSAAFGGYLQSLGLRKGARVALMMPNVLQYPIALMGALRAGYTVVNVNPLYTPRELEHQLKDSGAEAIVILENFAHTLQSVVANTPVRHVVVAALGDLLGLKGFAVNLVVRRVRKMVPRWSLKNHVRFNAALKGGRSANLKPVAVSAEDLAFLQYTGGTTGISKGAMLSHGNVLANIAQNAAWLESAYIRRERPEKPVYACALPLYHIYALTVNAVMGMQQGAQNVLIVNPRDLPAFVKEISRYKINVLPGLNTLFNALLNNKEFQKLDFSALGLTFGGGMAVQASVAERWHKLTGCVVSEGYGLSETSPVATANRFDAEQFSGTIGLPLPSTEISIRDEENREVPLGEPGEICIRGPQVMVGYWNRPDETAKVMTPDGFLKSGDIGAMNAEGFTKIVDRKKDMILVSGFNVYPNEIEEVVARHPKVLEAAAVGVPDEKSGEVPKLFVVKKDETLTEDELRDFCRENLTAYKRPRHFEFRAELPKTNVGKILRRELRN